MLDGEVIGSVVQLTYGRGHAVEDTANYEAQTPDSKRHGVSIGGFDSAVRCLVEHVLDQREIEDSLATLAPSQRDAVARRNKALDQAYTAVLSALEEQEAIDETAAAWSALDAARQALKVAAQIEEFSLTN